MTRSIHKIVFSLASVATRILPLSWIEGGIRMLLSARITHESPEQSLKLLLRLDNHIYKITGTEAIRYGQGYHVKQRLTEYIEFFTLKANQLGGPFLDVGCSTGEMTSRLATTTSARVIGIDINELSIREAKRRHEYSNLIFLVGDMTTKKLAGPFKTIILSVISS